MARLAHYVTQRGNRRERVVFDDGDYCVYLGLVGAAARRAGTEVWGLLPPEPTSDRGRERRPIWQTVIVIRPI
jgi:hypothetical protein